MVGHDWGGIVAWTLAMNHPEVVDRLVILNAAHPRKLNEGLQEPAAAPEELVLLLLPVPGAAGASRARDDWRFFKGFLRDAHAGRTPTRSWSVHRGVVAAGGGQRR